jgi:crossover junction endodeoxyribonuclease RuvC
MTILGIDPGTQRIGYGLVRCEGQRVKLVEAGILAIREKGQGALSEAKHGVDRLITTFKPGALALEKVFFTKNQKTAMAVAQARGVIMLAALEAGLPVHEYTPSEVKRAVAGHGGADKKAVAKMVRLTLREPTLSVIDDASDALALAILGAREGQK